MWDHFLVINVEARTATAIRIYSNMDLSLLKVCNGYCGFILCSVVVVCDFLNFIASLVTQICGILAHFLFCLCMASIGYCCFRVFVAAGFLNLASLLKNITTRSIYYFAYGFN